VADPWPLDVLTRDYLISGVVDGDGQRWGWTYFSPVAESPAAALDLVVGGVRSTGRRPPPHLAGTRASFNFGTELLALIPRGGAADAAWEQWAGKVGAPVAAEVFVGPYAVTGGVYSADRTMSVLLNDRFAVRDAVFTRIDGEGDAPPIDAPRAMVATIGVQMAVVTA
jgi:hypothetical protein